MEKPKSAVGTMAYYREMESYNTQLRSRLLARTKRKTNETPRRWLQRVSTEYEKKRIKTRG